MNSHTPNVYEKVETIFLVKKSTFKFYVLELFQRETVQIWCNSPIYMYSVLFRWWIIIIVAPASLGIK